MLVRRGEDGGDGAWVEKQKFPSLLLGDDALRKAYSINLAEGRDKQGPVTQGVPLDVDVAAACRARDEPETLVGFRRTGDDRAVVNPPDKSTKRVWDYYDMLVVLAED